MSAPAWISRNKETPSDVVSIIKSAKVNGCWIFHERNQKSYTSEEFEKEWQTVVHSDGKTNNFKEFKIVNPLYAVRLTSRWINIANRRQQEILLKLEGYNGEFKKKV